MKPTAPLALIAAISLTALVGCANPSHQTDAEDLRGRLADLPGVSKAELDYSEPVTLDSGKLALRVTMARDADADEITEVVTTTYDAFSDTHHGEEGDLDVEIGDDLLHLRSFEPDAEGDAVEEATSRAVAVLPSGQVRADINTQDVSKEPHVFTRYTVSVAKPGRDSVLAKLTALETRYGDLPDAGWRVQSGGESGWLISAEKGFPDAEELALFDEMSEGLPDGAAILLYGDFGTLQVPPGTAPAEVSAAVGRHLALLGGADTAFYDVQSGPDLLMSFTDGDCYFDTGAVGARLERDHGAGCPQVTHPEG